MAIVYPLSLPVGSRNAAQIVIRGTSVTASSESPYTFQEQVQVFPGQRWTATITLPPLKRADADTWMAFLLSLNGREGTFLMGDASAAQPKGVATGSPVVDGAGQTGNVLNITGATPNITNWLRAGDYIHMVVGGNYRLHMNLENVNTDGAGKTALSLWPRLRESPGNGIAIVTTNTLGQWRLDQNYSERTIDVASVYSQSFSCVESI